MRHAWDRLAAEAGALASKQQHAEAARLLKAYDGPFAGELLTKRKALAATYNDSPVKPPEERQTRDEQQLLNRIGGLLSTGACAAAHAEIAARLAATPAPDVQALEALKRIDAVIVADYGKGFLTQAAADYICSNTKARGKILAVDPHPHTSLNWGGATVIKPNRAEAFLAAGLPPSEPVDPPLADQPLLEAGRRLLEKWRPESLLMTLGEQGILLFREGKPPYHTPTRAKEVFDVSGAGDTAIAVLTLALAAGATPEGAAELANCASGIVVGKVGTATVTAAELAEQAPCLPCV